MTISYKSKQDEIAKIVDQKLKNRVCPICGNNHFLLAPGMTPINIQDNLEVITLGGINVPAIMLICSKCGNISFHSIMVLGLDELLGIQKGE